MKQAEATKELQMAEPVLAKAMTALESLDRRELGNCKTMNKGEILPLLFLVLVLVFAFISTQQTLN